MADKLRLWQHGEMTATCCQQPTLDPSVTEAWRREFDESIWSVFVAAIGSSMSANQTQQVVQGPPETVVQLAMPDGSDDPISGWTVAQFVERCKPGGSMETWLTQAWIVDQYGRWDSGWRKRIAEAGCHSCGAPLETGDVQNDAMGDLRHLRHDVCHHLGTATTDHSTRLKVLAPRQAGQAVDLSMSEFRELLDAATCFA